MSAWPPITLFRQNTEEPSTPLTILTAASIDSFQKSLSSSARAFLSATSASRQPGSTWLVPGTAGLERAALIVSDPLDPFEYAELPQKLPAGTYRIDAELDAAKANALCLGFGLGSYRFERYKKETRGARTLIWPSTAQTKRILALLEGIYWTRDLINTPASDMGPRALAEVARALAKAHSAEFKVTIGQKLLDENYPMIHAVGRAAAEEPRLIDFSWGKKNAPRLTLVGKGVCFDTGGLDLKPPQYMKLMKKDMGGAALVLGLAHVLMTLDLPVRLRVLVPAVENSVSGNAMRPLDVLHSRKGLTVEVGDTDAEGRLILADALFEASSEKPDLIVDAATLTGAARVALGTAMPAVFATRDDTWQALEIASRASYDPLWRLPLHKPYKKKLASKVADLSNIGDSYAGAITAALFLNEFVEGDWVHVDTMGYNLESSAGRPLGGEALGLVAMVGWLEERYRPVGSLPTPRPARAKPTHQVSTKPSSRLAKGSPTKKRRS